MLSGSCDSSISTVLQVSNFYPLRIVASVWESLYLGALRLRQESPKNLSDIVFLQRWDNDFSPVGGIMRKTQARMEKLIRNDCSSTSAALASCWESAVSDPGSILVQRPSLEALSLFHSRSFGGAVWSYTSLVCYVPEYRSVMSFKINSDEFARIRSVVEQTAPSKSDPFSGMKFTLTNSQIAKAFKRIRRIGSTKIVLSTVSWVESHKELMQRCSDLYIEPEALEEIVRGWAPLNLTEYFVSRFHNTHAFFFPFISECRVVGLRDRGWSYRISINSGKMNLEGDLESARFLDPSYDIDELRNLKVCILGLLPIGVNERFLRETSFPIIAISPKFNFQGPPENKVVQTSPPSISSVVSELRQAFSFKIPTALSPSPPPLLPAPLGTQKGAVEEQIKIPLAPPPKPPPEPVYRIFNESDFQPIQGRLLLILSSDRKKIFNIRELVAKMKAEGFSATTEAEVAENLRSLAVKDAPLVYADIVGTGWFLNPRIKVMPKSKPITQEAVEERILHFLEERYPNKVSKFALVNLLCAEDSRVLPRVAVRAISKLRSSKKIYEDKSKRCFWNESPPSEHPGRKSVRPPRTITEPVNLTESQLTNALGKIRPSVGSVITIHKRGSENKRRLVLPTENATEIVSGLLSDLKNERIASAEFEDRRWGKFRLVASSGRVATTFWCTNTWSKKHLMDIVNRK